MGSVNLNGCPMLLVSGITIIMALNAILPYGYDLKRKGRKFLSLLSLKCILYSIRRVKDIKFST